MLQKMQLRGVLDFPIFDTQGRPRMHESFTLRCYTNLKTGTTTTMQLFTETGVAQKLIITYLNVDDKCAVNTLAYKTYALSSSQTFRRLSAERHCQSSHRST